MELNKEMTAQESLTLIAETINNSRKDVIRRSGRYYIIWGALLTFFSLLIYLLWKTSGNAAWNNLWFAMPLIGFPLSRMLKAKDGAGQEKNIVTSTVGGIWTSFCVFACSVAVFCLVYGLLTNNAIGNIVVGASLTAMIVLLFGLAETVTGVALKNWVIKIAGFVTGIGGIIVYYVTGTNKEQMLIFTFAGIVLMATGLIVKRQN
jgi:hypothetical protein